MSSRRRLATVLGAFALTAAFAGVPAGADTTPTGGANNLVLVQNETDGDWLARASTQVVPTGSDTVTSANIAIATNTACIGCHSTAAAVQILIVHGSPSYFAPGNAATAVNGGCDSCGAYAYARQHWIQVDRSTTLSGATKQRIAELRQEISAAAASILPSDRATDPCAPLDDTCLDRNEQLDAKLNALTTELISVVTADLQAAGASPFVLFDGVS